MSFAPVAQFGGILMGKMGTDTLMNAYALMNLSPVINCRERQCFEGKACMDWKKDVVCKD